MPIDGENQDQYKRKKGRKYLMLLPCETKQRGGDRNIIEKI